MKRLIWHCPSSLHYLHSLVSPVLHDDDSQFPSLPNQKDLQDQPMDSNNSTTDPPSPSLLNPSLHSAVEVPMDRVVMVHGTEVFDFPSRYSQKNHFVEIRLPNVAVVVVVHLQKFPGEVQTLRITCAALEQGSFDLECVVVVVDPMEWFQVDMEQGEVSVVAIDPLVVEGSLVDLVGTLPFSVVAVAAVASVDDATSAVVVESAVVLPDDIPEGILLALVAPFLDTLVPDTVASSVPVVAAAASFAFSLAAAVVAVHRMLASVAAVAVVPVLPQPPPPSVSSSVSSFSSVVLQSLHLVESLVVGVVVVVVAAAAVVVVEV